ncbi:MAG: fumarylacetoacetate hydrolase family protein [Rhodospirillales bacterium]|jgi:2-keto-4-pentenoate hydratase/2-oxohepta-3-ene-1,7-dioic acid hydratase in catechol pathway
MRFASFEIQNRASYGLVRGDTIIDIGAEFGDRYASLKAAIAGDALGNIGAWAMDQPGGLALTSIRFLPVIPDADRIACFGLNYRKRNPAGGDVTEMEYPTIFLKAPGALVGHNQNMVKSVHSDCFDYEAELALIIGKPGRNIAAEIALDHVAGYTCLNDGSMRDWQKHSTVAGKNFTASGAVGPWMVTKDEFPDPGAIRVISRLNGQEMQNDTVDRMFFGIAEQIEYLSKIMELRPGDIIATGSPEGSGGQREPQVFMQPGDVIEIEVPGIGVLRNPIVGDGLA